MDRSVRLDGRINSCDERALLELGGGLRFHFIMTFLSWAPFGSLPARHTEEGRIVDAT